MARDKDTQTINFAALPVVTYAPNLNVDVAVSATSGLHVNITSKNTGVATVAGSRLKIEGKGTAIIEATQGGSGHYEAADPVERTLTVNGQSQTITFDPIPTQTYAPDGPVAVTVSASSGLAVDLSTELPSVAVASAGVITIKGAGTTKVYANQAGDHRYDAAPTAEVTLTVTPAPQAIAFGPLADKTVGATFTLAASSDAGLPVTTFTSSGGNVTIAGATASAVSPGTCSLTASQPGNANYQSASASASQQVLPDDVVVAEGSGTVSGNYNVDIGDAAGAAGNKHLRIEVPAYKVEGTHYTGTGVRPVSYIHLGSQRTDGTEQSRGDDMLTAIGLSATPDYFFRDDYRRKNDEQHPSATYHRRDGVRVESGTSKDYVKSRTRELRTRGGWREHTDGNRVTTTRGDRVEVVYGNYKMVVLGRLERSVWGESYWESSGGHNKDATNTPGEVIHIGWQPSDVTGTPTGTYPPTGGGSWKVTDETVKGNVIERYLGNQYEWYECDYIVSTTGDATPTADIPTVAASAQEHTTHDTKWLNAAGRKKENPAISESVTATTIVETTKVESISDLAWSKGGTDLSGKVDEDEEVTTKVEHVYVAGTQKGTKIAAHVYELTGTLSQPVANFKEELYAKDLKEEEYFVSKFELTRGLYYLTNKGHAVAFRFGASASISLSAGVEFALGTFTVGANIATSTEITVAASVELNIGLKYKYATAQDGVGMSDTQFNLLCWWSSINEDRIAAADADTGPKFWT